MIFLRSHPTKFNSDNPVHKIWFSLHICRLLHSMIDRNYQLIGQGTLSLRWAPSLPNSTHPTPPKPIRCVQPITYFLQPHCFPAATNRGHEMPARLRPNESLISLQYYILPTRACSSRRCNTLRFVMLQVVLSLFWINFTAVYNSCHVFLTFFV